MKEIKKRLSMREQRAIVQSIYFHNRPPLACSKGVWEREWKENGAKLSTIEKNKRMDSIKPVAISNTQARYKLYAYND